MKKESAPKINSTPIHRLPDFDIALKTYTKILVEQNVPENDAIRIASSIQDGNLTRRQANAFINFVQHLERNKHIQK